MRFFLLCASPRYTWGARGGDLPLRDWRRYFRKCNRLLKQVEDWAESSEIRHLLRDVLPSYWKKRVEDEENKRAKKRLAVRTMSPKDQHPRMKKCFRQNLGEPDRMISVKNSVDVEVSGDVAGGMFAAAQQRRVETWGEAENADDPILYEHGGNSPNRERGIEAKFQKQNPH